MVAIDLRTRTPQQFAAMLADKLARLAITVAAPSADAGAPARDDASVPGWFWRSRGRGAVDHRGRGH